jgi:hypothetical protein
VTWKKYTHLNHLGVDLVGCSGGGGGIPDPLGMKCNAYSGDTSCDTLLPVLCVRDIALARPALPPASEFYFGWSGGLIKLTEPVRGSSFRHKSAVDRFCENRVGYGWSVASFHEGNGGWNYYSYGEIASDKRFWVDIRDQNATCWNR